MLPVFSEAKAWLLGHALVILGVALALTVGYASWLKFVTVPRLEKNVEVAQAKEAEAKANLASAVTTNRSLAVSVDRCNASIDALREEGDATRADVGRLLKQLAGVGANVKLQLGAFRPDVTKSDCENAKAELQKFKAKRGN